MNLAFLAKRALKYLVCATCALTLCNSSIRAETSDLYRQGFAAYIQGDCRSALRYFSAYSQQSQSTTYSDPDFPSKLHEAILYCERKLQPKSTTEIESEGRLDRPPPPDLPVEPPEAGGAQPLFASFRLPGDGMRNNNQAIGPFCCTGETAIVRQSDGKPIGYIYFFGWKGQAHNFGTNESGALDMEVLVSGLTNLSDLQSEQQKSSVSFLASEMVPGASRSTKAGSLYFRVTILKANLKKFRGIPYFDMDSVAVRVEISASR